MKPIRLAEAPAVPEPNLYLAWYEAWRAEEERRSAAEAAARAEMARGVRVLVGLLVAWTVLAGLAGGAAMVIWTGGGSGGGGTPARRPPPTVLYQQTSR